MSALLWLAAVIGLCFIVLLPIISIFVLALRPSDNLWPHLMSSVLFGSAAGWKWSLAVCGILAAVGSYWLGSELRAVRTTLFLVGSISALIGVALLPGAVPQTLYLMAGVGLLTLFIGATTAWLVTMYQFPGRGFFDWMLILPLAMPTYIIAFCYVEAFDYSGGLQTAIRELFGFRNASDYWFPKIRSDIGAIFVMSMVLYPYVYLTARASFTQQSVCVLEVARTLGRSSFGIFLSVALPLARPALVAGVALALMECLNDVGAVEYFGVNTLTLSIYATWLERSSLSGAAQIASVMLIFVLALFFIEKRARAGQSYHHTTGRYRTITQARLEGAARWGATCFCLLPLLLGFALPVFVLLQSTLVFFDDATSGAFWTAARNSIFLAVVTSLVAVSLSLLLAYVHRVMPTRLVRGAFRGAGIGYAVPGTVLAVGILIPLAGFDNLLDGYVRSNFGVSTGLLLSGSAFALIFAYTVRFIAISNGNLDAGFNRISPNLDAVSRSLGAGRFETLWRVNIPLLRPAVGAALLLVFVETMKELPATLLLRPFNFDTLATHVYTFASLEQFEEAGVAALMIVAIGLIPVILLSRTIVTSRAGSGRVNDS